KKQEFSGVLESSVDGRSYRPIKEFKSTGAELVLDFDEVTARSFRLLFKWVQPGLKSLEFTDLDLAPVYEIPSFQAKSGLARGGEAKPIPNGLPPQAIVPLDKIVHLTDQVDTY